jgi:glycerophosphoryl diester phosphodiesterase
LAHRRENTLDAFVHAQGLGIGGVETDAWVTTDNVVVLHHDRRVRTPTGRRAIAATRRAELPPHVPSLADLYSACGTGLDIAVDILDARAAALCLAAAHAADPSATRRLWLCGTDLEALTSWRRLSPDVRLVHSDPRWRAHRRDLDGYLHELRNRGVDVLNLPARHCSGAVAAACHSEHVLLFAWGAQRVATIRRLQRAGVDGIMGNHVDRLVAATTGSSAITCDAR